MTTQNEIFYIITDHGEYEDVLSFANWKPRTFESRDAAEKVAQYLPQPTNGIKGYRIITGEEKAVLVVNPHSKKIVKNG